MLGVVENLFAIVMARVGHRGDAQKSVLDYHHRAGLLVLPEAPVGLGKSRRQPVALAGNDRGKIGILDYFFSRLGHESKISQVTKELSFR